MAEFAPGTKSVHTGPEAQRRLRRRYAREARFKAYGILAILIALAALGWLLFTMVKTGFTVFQQHFLTIEVELKEELIDPAGTRDMAAIRRRDYKPLLFDAILARLPQTKEVFDRIDRAYQASDQVVEEKRREVAARAELRRKISDELLGLLDRGAALEIVKETVLEDTGLVGTAVPVTLPASPLLASYARLGGAQTGPMTAYQREVAAGLLSQDRIRTREDGSATVLADVDYAEYIVDPRGRGDEDDVERGDFGRVLGRSLAAYGEKAGAAFSELENKAIDAEKVRDDALRTMRMLRREQFDVRDQILSMVSESGAGHQLRLLVQDQPELIGKTVTVQVPVSDDIDQYLKGNVNTDIPEERRTVKDSQIEWAGQLNAAGEIEKKFNHIFFTSPDSQEPELAGIASALIGSLMALSVCFLLSFPTGVAAAIYLEEFAPRNRWTDLIEVNINNLAAVPSIIFGLLGLAVFINFAGLPISAPLVGGIVLALMTLPTIIIASRAALKAVPPSIREGALGVGASRQQSVFHHVLPLAMPGMLTGSIIGMAQALGETAPLLMIGMVAFVTDIPSGFTDPAPALPVQIFMWSDRPQAGFVERTAGAIIVLLTVLFAVNIAAILARRRFERRW